MLQQTIDNEELYTFDTDGDGVDDDSVEVRESSNHEIDWTRHEGWYLDLIYQIPLGEQVLATPVLRDGKILISTHIPTGDECAPQQQGWLMVLDATNGGMPDGGLLDLNGDNQLNERPLSGIRNQVNPFASPTVVGGTDRDIIISQSEIDPDPQSLAMASTFIDGRITWRELEP